MTTLLLALAFQQGAALRVTELVEPSQIVVLQAFIKAPRQYDLASWYVLGDCLLKGTTEYTEQKIRDYGSQAGIPPQVTVMDDFMRIQFVAPTGGLNVCVDLLNAVMTRPTLAQDDVRSAAKARASLAPPPIIAALQGTAPDFAKVDPLAVKETWERAFRPENVSFVVGGGVSEGYGRQRLESKFASWNPPRVLRSAIAGSPKPHVKSEGTVSTFVLRGPAMSPVSGMGAAETLAVFAIGVGKDASMFRVLREEMGLSYTQFAVLWPTQKGWVPSLVMARKAVGDEGAIAVKMRDALLKDVDGWSEESLARAVSMAEASFERRFSNSPVWVGPSGPLTDSLSDRCAWRGYLTMVGSAAIQEDTLVAAMHQVDLDRLKSAARKILNECSMAWVPGNPR